MLPPEPQNADRFTIEMTLTLKAFIFAMGNTFVRGTPRGMFMAWLNLLGLFVPSAFIYVLTSYEGELHPLRFSLPMMPMTAVAVLLMLAFRVRPRPRNLKSIVLEPRRVTFARYDGSSEVIENGLQSIEENEDEFTVQLRVNPISSFVAPWLAIDKRKLPENGAAILRRLGQLTAPQPEPTSGWGSDDL